MCGRILHENEETRCRPLWHVRIFGGLFGWFGWFRRLRFWNFFQLLWFVLDIDFSLLSHSVVYNKKKMFSPVFCNSAVPGYQESITSGQNASYRTRKTVQVISAEKDHAHSNYRCSKVSLFVALLGLHNFSRNFHLGCWHQHENQRNVRNSLRCGKYN